MRYDDSKPPPETDLMMAQIAYVRNAINYFIIDIHCALLKEKHQF